jgi:alanyl-tRNA synthetase
MSSDQRKPVTARAVRQQFLDFFAARGHRIVPSSPVFPQDDPTLLFTNAGMNQFKDVFLGTGTRPYTRAVDTQKCIRVSGKHNDLEEVGVDHYHHTFFEMLGNWSFGDYFKREAIGWSWELLTQHWGLPKERLWVTVFGGDEQDGLPADEEALKLWRECTDVDPARILRFGRKANFWEMGDTGPCGPCTEIHFDTGGPGTDPRDGAHPERGVNGPNARFLELWNNVFMEFNRLDNGSLAPLPARHVDTGMGLERIVRVLQGKASNYDTDLFAPLFGATAKLCGRAYGGSDARADVAFRVIADHARAVCVALADGALPSNTGRGYVLRRLIRRAARYGRQELALEQPFLCSLVPAVVEILGEPFPELGARAQHLELVLREEELAFGRTLGRGLARFSELERRCSAAGARHLPGDEAFELYATYGFPEDLIELMAREKGLELDRSAFDVAQLAHQRASKSEARFKQLLSAEESQGLPATHSTYHEVGERALELETSALRLLSGRADGQDVLVLADSPFYPEGGGQIGDRGLVTALDGSLRFRVEDTRRVGQLVAHVGRAEGALKPGAAVRASVDREARAATRRNHTATHLLHLALREALGTHVVQQGSYVGPDRLRFDFSHPKAVAQDELERIEKRVNELVLVNAPLSTSLESLEAAKERGALALFGEKYEGEVRVVAVGSHSLELCGGTHVSAAGDIGPFWIAYERAVSAGVRRIEALTGTAALEELQRQRRLLQAAAQALKSPADEIETRIAQLQQELKAERKKSAAGASADLGRSFERVQQAFAAAPGPVRALVLDLHDADGAALRELMGRAKSLGPDHCIALFGREQGRVPFVIAVGGLALQRGLSAGALALQLKALLGGGGGGKPDLAQGQGATAEALPQALAVLNGAIEAALKSGVSAAAPSAGGSAR